jgi:hypothetical protein
MSDVSTDAEAAQKRYVTSHKSQACAAAVVTTGSYILYYFIRDCVSQITCWNSCLVMHEYASFGIKSQKMLKIARLMDPLACIRQTSASKR